MSACLYLNSRNNNNICDPRRQGMQPVQHTHTLKKQLIQRWKNSEGKCSSPMTTSSRQETSWSRKQKVLWRQERSSPRSRHLPSAIFLFFFFYFTTWRRTIVSAFRRQERRNFFIFILLHGDGLCQSPRARHVWFYFWFYFLKVGDRAFGSLWSPCF